MRVAIRVDAAAWIGTGHVIRCVTLAGALRERGADVLFVCRSLPDDRIVWLEGQGYQVRRLTAPATPLFDKDKSGNEAWLGVESDLEVRESAATLSAAGPFDWLVADHYGLGADWERAMRPFCNRIFVIDDLGDREHDCDLLLDQNLVAGMHARYTSLVPSSCRQMLGPDYALLQPAYAEWHGRVPVRKETIGRILIFFGGIDPGDMTGKVLAALSRHGRSELQVDVVVSSSNPHREALVREVAAMPGAKLHEDLPTLAPLMAAADLAIGAGGTTTWERCCLGLPTLVVTLAGNQVPIARELHARGLVRWLGNADEIDSSGLAAVLADVLGHALPESWSRSCSELVDGQGTHRVVAIMEANEQMPFSLRDAKFCDEQLLLDWANDPLVRRNAFLPETIGREVHQKWFRARLMDMANNRIYIAETNHGVPFGQVRFERRNGEWLIGYSLDALFRGVGLGSRVLGAAIRRHSQELGDSVLVGCVKDFNLASCRVFEQLGFAARNGGEGVTEYRLATGCSETIISARLSLHQQRRIIEKP